MPRSLHGTIGATLLCCVALTGQSQNQPASPPATASGVAKSLGLIIYPAKGQDAGQQSTDEQQCYDWAKAQTGIDPQAPPPAAAPAESKGAGGQRVRGAAKARQEKKAQEEQAKTTAQAAQTEQQTTFKKAMGTCPQGRGYTTG